LDDEGGRHDRPRVTDDRSLRPGDGSAGGRIRVGPGNLGN
jgi:hypothetical protein